MKCTTIRDMVGLLKKIIEEEFMKIYLWLGLVVIICVLSNNAQACSCPFPNYLEKYHEADVVFAGQVDAIEKITHPNAQQKVTFFVAKSWKGKRANILDVLNDQKNDCFAPYQARQNYLVFAHRLEDGSLAAGSCSIADISTLLIQQTDEGLRTILDQATISLN